MRHQTSHPRALAEARVKPTQSILFKLTASVFLVVGALLLYVTPTKAELFEAHEFKLDNGLQVVVLPNRLSPIVQHMLFYKAGSAEELQGVSGAAHYLEHLMFKGTEKFPDGRFSELVAENGGSENAFTSFDFTGYFQTVSKENLALVMELEADRMTNLKLTEEMIEPELAVVMEERRQRTDNSPNGIMREEVQAALYMNHPYGRPIIGWEHEIRALTLKDIWDYYQTWYAPNNAVLVIGGDVNVEDVKVLAEKFYGPIPFKAVPKRNRPFEPKHRVARTMEYADTRVGLPSYSIQYLAPATRKDDLLFGDLGLEQDKASYALTVFADAFGGGSASPLYRKLVIEDKSATSVGAFYASSAADYGTFGFYVAPNRGEELEPAIDALNVEIENVLLEGLSQEDLDRSKRKLIRSAILARDDLKTAPNLVGRAIATGESLSDLQNWANMIEAVTLDEVNTVTRALLKEEGAMSLNSNCTFRFQFCSSTRYSGSNKPPRH